MSAKKILIYYPLLEWYIQQGLSVTKVYGMIHCKKWKIFKGFGELEILIRKIIFEYYNINDLKEKSNQ